MRQTCHLLVLNHRTMLFFLKIYILFWCWISEIPPLSVSSSVLGLLATLWGVRRFLFTSLFRHVWASIWTLLLVPSLVNCSLKNSAQQSELKCLCIYLPCFFSPVEKVSQFFKWKMWYPEGVHAHTQKQYAVCYLMNSHCALGLGSFGQEVQRVLVPWN